MTSFEIPNSRVVKITAKTALKNGIAESVVIGMLLLCPTLLSFILNNVISIMGEWTVPVTVALSIIFSVFISAPLLFGAVRYFWRLTDGVIDHLSSLFYYFQDKLQYLKALRLTFVIGWRVLTATFVCMLPYALVSVISGSAFYQLIGSEIPLWVPNLVLIRGFLYFVGVACSLLFISRYYLAPVLVVMDEDMLLLEAVHVSCMVSKRSLSSFFALVFSLGFWILLSLFFLPAIFTLPVILSSYVVHSRFAMVNYNLVVDYYDNNMIGYFDEEE